MVLLNYGKVDRLGLKCLYSTRGVPSFSLVVLRFSVIQIWLPSLTVLYTLPSMSVTVSVWGLMFMVTVLLTVLYFVASFGVNSTVSCWLSPMFSAVPNWGVYVNVPGTLAVAFNCVSLRAVQLTISEELDQVIIGSVFSMIGSDSDVLQACVANTSVTSKQNLIC